MSYYSSSGVIRGVHVSDADPEDEGKFSELGLDTFVYTDTNTWDMVVGEAVVPMEENEIREVRIKETDTYHDNSLKERIRQAGILSDDVIENNFGVWFIQGGA